MSLAEQHSEVRAEERETTRDNEVCNVQACRQPTYGIFTVAAVSEVIGSSGCTMKRYAAVATLIILASAD